MAQLHLPRSAFKLSAAPKKRDTIIEDFPQVSVRRQAPSMPTAKNSIISPMSEDFPTPKALPSTASTAFTLCFPIEELQRPASPTSSDSRSENDSYWSERSSNTSFDDMYDLTSSESEDVHIKLSSSLKRRVGRASKKNISVVISPPGKTKSDKTRMSPSATLQLSPAILKQFQAQSLTIPYTSSAPSLDGSLTSDEIATASCPPTPDMRSSADENEWEDAPIMLDPSAFQLLQHISGEAQHQRETIIEIDEADMQEMREVVESPSRFGGLQIQTGFKASDSSNDELSALSVPSPSHFFSSLDSAMARRAWASHDEVPNTSTATEFYGMPFGAKKETHKEAPLNTSTATSFYDVPWKSRPENPVEHVITLAEESEEEPEEPITARRVKSSPVEPVPQVQEIDETYQENLQQTASANLDRTQLWLSSQSAYLDNILTDDESAVESPKDDVSVSTPFEETPSPSDSVLSPRKAVRFADAEPEAPAVQTQASAQLAKGAKRVSPIHDGTFWEAFCHNKRSQRARDVFQHRQMRAEAEQTRRGSASKAHAEQLKGHFEAAKQPQQASGAVNNEQEDAEKREQIAIAERQRAALQQIQPSSWHVDAQKELNGGTLLTSPTVATFKRRSDVNILDLAGQAHCSWAWDVAVTHPNAVVYTTVATDVEAHIAESSLEGPANHRVIAAPKLWDLPFGDCTFDVVSARNLYMHLRTQTATNADEWDLTLRECMRVLKPSGYLEFDLLDAEMTRPEATAQALGVEFSFNLKTRGYDPSSGKNFLPRLKRAGFGNIKRAWMVLPAANSASHPTSSAQQGPMIIATPTTGISTVFPSAGLKSPENYGPPLTGSTQDVRAITGLVGSRSWEQWMLKINAELGRSEERCLEGVYEALEESGKTNAGWRCLVGWAQKSM